MERIRRKPLNEIFDDQESIEPCGYLALKEYKRLVDRDTELTEKEFKKLLRKASALLDIQTRRFYQRNDLESDIPMRRDAFKLAVAYQIEYMHEAEATTTFGMQEPDSWSIGRKVWHRVVSADKTKQWTGHATVTDIVAGSGAADATEDFSCTITFDATPTEGVPGSSGSNSDTALNSAPVSNKANKKEETK